MSKLVRKLGNYIFSVKRLYKAGEPSLIKQDDLSIINSRMDFVVN